MTDPTPQTTLTRDEAVRKACHVLRQWAAFFNDDSARQSAKEIIDLLASAPAPASGGVDAVAELAAQICETARPIQGVVIEYGGTKFVSIDDVNAELDRRAAKIRSLSPAATPVSEAGGDWPEDVAHENGNYQNLCCHCGKQFVGHKRRVSCKACALAKPASSPAGVDVREALETCLSEMLEARDRLLCYHARTAGLDHGIDEARRALAKLSQSTSAGRVGE